MSQERNRQEARSWFDKEITPPFHRFSSPPPNPPPPPSLHVRWSRCVWRGGRGPRPRRQVLCRGTRSVRRMGLPAIPGARAREAFNFNFSFNAVVSESAARLALGPGAKRAALFNFHLRLFACRRSHLQLPRHPSEPPGPVARSAHRKGACGWGGGGASAIPAACAQGERARSR